jgi:hypothetical protein
MLFIHFTLVDLAKNWIRVVLCSLGSWGLTHPMSLTELALLDGRRPLPLGDVIGLTLNFKLLYSLRATSTENFASIVETCFFYESLHSNGRYADRIENNSSFLAGKFIGALPVAQQRSINTGTSIVACVITCLVNRCLAMLWPSTLQY